MKRKLEVTFGQLHILGGAILEEAQEAMVVEPPSLFLSGQEKSCLYALLEVEGQPPGKDESCRHLKEIIRQEYRRAAGSITAQMRQVIKAANNFLFEANQKAHLDEHLYCGLTCVVIKEGEVFIAQGGPGAVYVAERGALKRYPESSPWLDAPSIHEGDYDEHSPLGWKSGVEVHFARSQVGPGASILLASSSLAKSADRRKIAQVLNERNQDVEEKLENLAALAEESDLSALLIQISSASRQAVGKGLVAQEEPLLQIKALTMLEGIKLPAIDWKTLLAGLGSSLLFLGRGTFSLLKRMLPGREASRPRVPARHPRATSWQGGKVFLIALALLIPLMVALSMFIASARQRETNRAQQAELLAQARLKKEQAIAQSDKDIARALLYEARSILDQLKTLDSQDLRREIQARMDEINRVFKLHLTPLLNEYPEPGADPGRVIVNGIDIYVLDRGTKQVYKHVLNETEDGLQPSAESPVLLRAGDQVGEIIVGEPVDMVWMPAGGGRQKSNLLILESEGRLLEYSQTWGLRTLPLSGRESWGLPRLMGSYFGNLYLLDPELNQILKYLPTADGGYSNPFQPYLDPGIHIELAGAVDMAIDGFIYILFEDGTVLKLLASGDPLLARPVPFQLSGLDEPLKSPMALFTAPDSETKSIYVADSGNRRIVQFDKEGHFQRQFKADEGVLDSPKGLFVDEIGGKIYFVSGRRLYTGPIPPETLEEPKAE